MSARRAPSVPPDLPGYDFQSVIGSGGFADVFLYQQAMPSRPVAVKVLLPELVDRNLIEDFRREANVMAELSTHPSIVTVYSAAVSPDGRPFLAMEYCPRPNLGARYRRERLSVPEVLQLGVQIAGAVETAHRAGVLHRDIKPANILVTAYNRPALTDFGIATTAGEQADGSGMSIPWAPPESFDAVPSSTRESDVFSLAATLYTLLAGRTPFELPGMGNTSVDLIDRIRTGQLAPLARSDVPSSLWQVLRSAMEVEPSRRYPSAMAYGRALQQVESEMALGVTQMDVLDDSLPEDEVRDDDDGATRIRGIVSIEPQPVDDRTVRRGAMPADAAGQQSAQIDDEVAPRRAPSTPASRRRRLVTLISAGVGVVAVAAILVAVLLPRGPEGAVDPEESLDPVVQAQAPSAPIGVEGEIDGDQVTFTWTNPAPVDGDAYRVRIDETGAVTYEQATEETITVDVDPDGETCISVAVIRENGQASDFTTACVA